MISFKTYEVRALVSLIAGGLSLLASIALLGIVLFLFDAENRVIVSSVNRLLAIVGLTGVALGLGALGFLLGITTAGQKRNSKTNLSWLGFFGGAIGLTVAMSGFLFFWLAKS